MSDEYSRTVGFWISDGPNQRVTFHRLTDKRTPWTKNPISRCGVAVHPLPVVDTWDKVLERFGNMTCDDCKKPSLPEPDLELL